MSGNRSRAELLADLRRVGREHSDATVLFHSALATETRSASHRLQGARRAGSPRPDERGRTGPTHRAGRGVGDQPDRPAGRQGLPAPRTRPARPPPGAAARRRGAKLTDNEFFASWQRTRRPELWERYSDTELAVILDFLGDTAERLRSRTEAMAVGGSPRRTHGGAPSRCRTPSRLRRVEARRSALGIRYALGLTRRSAPHRRRGRGGGHLA